MHERDRISRHAAEIGRLPMWSEMVPQIMGTIDQFECSTYFLRNGTWPYQWLAARCTWSPRKLLSRQVQNIIQKQPYGKINEFCRLVKCNHKHGYCWEVNSGRQWTAIESISNLEASMIEIYLKRPTQAVKPTMNHFSPFVNLLGCGCWGVRSLGPVSNVQAAVCPCSLDMASHYLTRNVIELPLNKLALG
jgi:hypothetical protein